MDRIPFRARSGPAEIITTGIVISFNRQPIRIEFGSKTAPFSVTFNFVDQTETAEQKASLKVVGERDLEYTLINFTNPLGTGSTDPVKIGKYNGRPMFLHYRVYSIGESDKTVQFTFFAGPKEAVDA